ncbi:MAG: hypothetical protein LBU65_05540, partial [Planctomycetaceae bacterium]|nr:hypothetical protein [Planctomycetaceae bacterium]
IEDKIKIAKKGEDLGIDVSSDGDPLSAAIGLQATFGEISRGYCEQLEHWAYCIRNNPAPTYSDADLNDPEKKKLYPRCYPAVAMADAVIALTTNLAGELDETIEFDRKWFDYKDDATPESQYAKTDEEKKTYTPSLEREIYR